MFTILFYFLPRGGRWIVFPENVNVFRDPWAHERHFEEWTIVSLSSALEALGFLFSGRKDPLSHVSAGTGLPATAESTRASGSDRYHAQDGCYPGISVRYSQERLAYAGSIEMTCKSLRLSDVVTHENCFSKTFLSVQRGAIFKLHIVQYSDKFKHGIVLRPIVLLRSLLYCIVNLLLGRYTTIQCHA